MSLCNSLMPILTAVVIVGGGKGMTIVTNPIMELKSMTKFLRFTDGDERYLNFLNDDNLNKPYLEVSFPENYTRQSVIDVHVKRSIVLKCVSKTPITWITPLPKDFFFPIIPYDKTARTIVANETRLYINHLRLSKLRYTHTGFYQCCDKRSKIPKFSEESDLPSCSRKIYIFANDMDHLIVPAREQMPQNMVYIALVKNKPIYFPCKSTYSDATVKLISKRKINMDRHAFDPKRGFWIQIPSMKYHSAYDCVVTRGNVTQRRMFMAIYKGMTQDPKPKIRKLNYSGKIPINSNFSLECSVEINADDLVDVSWWIGDKKLNNQYYNDTSLKISVSSETEMPAPNQMKKKTVFSDLNITNIEKKHENTYRCMVKDHIGKVGTASMDIKIYDPFEEPNQGSNSSGVNERYVPQVLNLTASGENILVPLPPLSPICASRNFFCQAWGYPHPTISWFIEDFCDYQTNFSPALASAISTFNSTSPTVLYLGQFCNTSASKDDKKSKDGRARTLVLTDYNGATSHSHNVSWNISHQEIILSEDRHIIKSSIELDSSIKGKLICRAENSEGFDERSIDIIATKSLVEEEPVETITRYVGLIMSLLLALGSFFLFVILLITLSCSNNKKKATLGRKFVNIRMPSLEKMCELTLFDDDNRCKKSRFSMGTNNADSEFQFDARLEFPRNRLIIGRSLGEGAFGKVMEAQAIGLGQNDKSIAKVAVKMAKSNMDSVQLLSLVSEIKIMVTMGKHLNLVNLLGISSVFTDKIQSLMVIMEYCAHGNLRQHLIKGRPSFDLKTVPHKLDEESVVVGESDGVEQENTYLKPLHFKALNIQAPPQSDININLDNNNNNNKHGSSILFPDIGTNVPEEISSVHLDNENPCDCRTLEPMNYETLMCFSYQISRGMQYLASKNCIHRDLACRNILLDHNDIIKICDFGLSKDMYRYPQYVKKTDSPVPIKWMAIESLKDNVYTIKSDVWSYGIVLWELFSMGSTPYPGIELGADFVKKLEQGLRLEEPPYCGKDMYTMMVECWAQLPDDRPDFLKISQSIAELLETKTSSKSNSNSTQDCPHSNYGYYKNLTQQDYPCPTLYNESKKKPYFPRLDSKIKLSNLIQNRTSSKYQKSSVTMSKIKSNDSKKKERSSSRHEPKLSSSKVSLTKNISLESTVSTDSAFSTTDSSPKNSAPSRQNVKSANRRNNDANKSLYKFIHFYKSVTKLRNNSLSGDSALGSEKVDQT